jgi:hypothetical protein
MDIEGCTLIFSYAAWLNLTKDMAFGDESLEYIVNNYCLLITYCLLQSCNYFSLNVCITDLSDAFQCTQVNVLFFSVLKTFVLVQFQ